MNQLGLFQVPSPPEMLRRPPEPIARSAAIEGRYRFSLMRRWGEGPVVAWCGCNPSTADGAEDDPTLWRIMGFSFRWGYGAAVVVNVWPFRSPDMAALRRWCANCDREEWHVMCARNALAAAPLLAAADLAVAAWGNLVDPDVIAQDWLPQVEQAAGRPIAWRCLGVTRSGAPIHPMARGRHRVTDEMTAVDWRRR